MNIPSISNDSAAAREAQRQDRQLQQACRDFEGLFISIVLKEGMKPGLEPNEDSPSETGAGLQELAIEQAAYDLGSKGSLGLADLLYTQMSRISGGSRHD